MFFFPHAKKRRTFRFPFFLKTELVSISRTHFSVAGPFHLVDHRSNHRRVRRLETVILPIIFPDQFLSLKNICLRLNK